MHGEDKIAANKYEATSVSGCTEFLEGLEKSITAYSRPINRISLLIYLNTSLNSAGQHYFKSLGKGGLFCSYNMVLSTFKSLAT